ncbi:MAG: hypothetical protein AABX51_02485 [Nanoarchaeota archaeon]
MAIPETPIFYPYTFENLNAIIAGLKPCSDDRILAIGGSGDQAFALVEYADVVVAERNPEQLEYIKRRKIMLNAGDYFSFVHSAGLGFDNHQLDCNLDYFMEDGRKNRIHARLSHLELGEPKSLEEHASERKFTKIYASDANSKIHRRGTIQEQLAAILTGLEHGGLLYVASGYVSGLIDVRAMGLEEVQELTAAAREIENLYHPAVYMKVEA